MGHVDKCGQCFNDADIAAFLREPEVESDLRIDLDRRVIDSAWPGRGEPNQLATINSLADERQAETNHPIGCWDVNDKLVRSLVKSNCLAAEHPVEDRPSPARIPRKTHLASTPTPTNRKKYLLHRDHRYMQETVLVDPVEVMQSKESILLGTLFRMWLGRAHDFNDGTR